MSAPMNAIRFAAEELKFSVFGAIGAGYIPIGSRFANPIRMISVSNLTDALLVFSYDGVTNHFVLDAGASLFLDLCSNKTIPEGFYIGVGTNIWVQEIGTPTVGAVYVSAYYGQQ